ncbi:MAG: LTA synthase family protein, partial [Oscillospiraceae bacterium]|nr:LTA synthase family protein [Oscillospiraceae bacterium]
MKKFLSLFQTIGEKPWLRRGLQALTVLGVSLAQAFQLHYSMSRGLGDFFRLGLLLILLNLGILLWLNLGAKLLFQKWHISIAVTAVLVTVWSIANFYVVKFHGSPLLFSEFANFQTAMNVIDGYTLAWERRLTWMVLLGLAELGAALLLGLCRKRDTRFWDLRQILLTLGAFGGVTLLLWLSLFVWQKPKPRDTIAWDWHEGVEGYGYASIIVEDVDRSIHYLRLPENYSPDHLDSVQPSSAQTPSACPDIILIVNETFYDPAEIMDFHTDEDYMEDFCGIDGAVYGKALIPHVGGGTNNTEFEVLTGNSMALLTRYAPFNYVSLNKDETGAPRYLKALGYTSAALHCEPATNYSRHRAYPAMGFDTVVMGNENFICRKYGNRRNLDEDNYQDMLRVGESLGDGPRFLYLLTFQNHGGWESNDSSFDTVHVQEDFGDMTEILNEYLTSIRMSGTAFRALTEQVAASGRPTVICMLGDHAPSFIGKLPARESYSEEEKKMRQRLVPYVIWSNFDLDLPEETDYASAVDLMAMVYRAAGLPTSAYQDQILALHDLVPVRSPDGLYMTAAGEVGKIQDSPYQQAVELYYELEYNALHRG